MRSLGEAAFYRVRVFTNPIARPDIHHICFRYWKQARPASGLLRAYSGGEVDSSNLFSVSAGYEFLKAENSYLAACLKHFDEAYANSFAPLVWELAVKDLSELDFQLADARIRLRESQGMAMADEESAYFLRLNEDVRGLHREKMQDLEDRMKKAWKLDVGAM